MENLALLWGIIGPGVSGAIFGAGWWFWVDAVVCSAVQVSFLHYLPGIFASLAALMFNCVNKDEIGYDYYSPYGDDSEWSVHPLGIEEVSQSLRGAGGAAGSRQVRRQMRVKVEARAELLVEVEARTPARCEDGAVDAGEGDPERQAAGGGDAGHRRRRRGRRRLRLRGRAEPERETKCDERELEMWRLQLLHSLTSLGHSSSSYPNGLAKE